MRRCSAQVAPPQERGRQRLASRLRLVFLDRWNRLTRSCSWKEPEGETLDGTTHASERAPGWWVKARSHSMLFSQRSESA